MSSTENDSSRPKTISKKTVRNHMITGIVGIFVALLSIGGFVKASMMDLDRKQPRHQSRSRGEIKYYDLKYHSLLLLFIAGCLLLAGWAFFGAYNNRPQMYKIVDENE